MNQSPAIIRFFTSINVKAPGGEMSERDVQVKFDNKMCTTTDCDTFAKNSYNLAHYYLAFDLLAGDTIHLNPKELYDTLPSITLTPTDNVIKNSIVMLSAHWLHANGEHWVMEGMEKVLAVENGMYRKLKKNYGRIGCDMTVKATGVDVNCHRQTGNKTKSKELKMHKMGARLECKGQNSFKLYEMVRPLKMPWKKVEETAFAVQFQGEDDFREVLIWLMASWASHNDGSYEVTVAPPPVKDEETDSAKLRGSISSSMGSGNS